VQPAREMADNEKDSIGSDPAEGWCGATEMVGPERFR
jgi:hypothetical protein